MPSSACYTDHRSLHSFPTRRSSDLTKATPHDQHKSRPESISVIARIVRDDNSLSGSDYKDNSPLELHQSPLIIEHQQGSSPPLSARDRKSTRLNSSHRCISYAVFCLLHRPPLSPLFPYTTLFRSHQSDPSRPAQIPP